MSDEKLRELERRWKETGAPADEEAYLVERVRAGEALDWDGYSRLSELNVEAAAEYLRGRVERGELTQERLELAAYCGEAGARAVAVRQTKSDPIAVPELLDHLSHLLPTDPMILTRAAVSVALRCIELVHEPGTENSVGSFRAWVVCPCPDHRSTAVRASRRTDLPSWARWNLRYPERAVKRAVQEIGAGLVLEALTTGLVPWLLRLGDPLANDDF